MELIVILVVLAVIVLAGIALASYDQVGAAATRANLRINTPEGASFFSGWSGLLFEGAFALLVLTVFLVLIVKVVVPWIRKQTKGPGKGWKSGPNANWGRTDEPKKMDTEKMLQLAILSRLAGGDGGAPLVLQQPEATQESPSQFPEGWW